MSGATGPRPRLLASPRPAGDPARQRAGFAGAPRRGQAISRSGKRPGPGWLWLLLAPLACCGLPLLAAGLAAAGTLAWGGLGLALAVAVAGAALYGRHHKRPWPRARSGGPAGRGRADYLAGPRTSKCPSCGGEGCRQLSGIYLVGHQVPQVAGPGLGDRHADRDRAR